jgi:hypothetical protein
MVYYAEVKFEHTLLSPEWKCILYKVGLLFLRRQVKLFARNVLHLVLILGFYLRCLRCEVISGKWLLDRLLGRILVRSFF